MSRYNQFVGQSGAQKINGADTTEGAQVLARVTPQINSWVARCRLLAQSSGLGYFARSLNTSVFDADWMWNNGNELLRVDVKSSKEQAEEKVEKRIERKEEFEPYKEQPEEFTEEKPVFDEIKVQEVQVENGLIPVQPQLIKCLVILYDNTDCVVYDMRSIEKGLDNQKPLIPNFKTQGNWEIPVPHVTVRRLRDYFGQAINGGSNSNYWDYLSHYCLQMKNSLVMGSCAVATVTFSGGIFSGSGSYGVYRMQAGLKSCQTIGGPYYIGQVGLNSGFPALNATDNMLFANSVKFTLNDVGGLEFAESDAYGHDGDLASQYSVPSTPLIPRFIDSNGEAYFDLAYNWAYLLPSMGERWLTDLFSPTLNDFKRAFSAGETSGTTTIAYPVLTQENGIDVLRAKIIDAAYELRESEFGANTWYTSSLGSFEGEGAPYGLFTVPYPPTDHDYTVSYNDGGVTTLESTFLAADKSNFDIRPAPQSPGPEHEHTFLGTMQVSNGEHNLQAYVVHGSSYDDVNKGWPLESWHIYLNGNDITSTMESITGASAKDIQIVFMDVPLYSAETIKRFKVE